jgi:hypothetical protein
MLNRASTVWTWTGPHGLLRYSRYLAPPAHLRAIPEELRLQGRSVRLDRMIDLVQPRFRHVDQADAIKVLAEVAPRCGGPTASAI